MKLVAVAQDAAPLEDVERYVFAQVMVKRATDGALGQPHEVDAERAATSPIDGVRERDAAP